MKKEKIPTKKHRTQQSFIQLYGLAERQARVWDYWDLVEKGGGGKRDQYSHHFPPRGICQLNCTRRKGKKCSIKWIKSRSEILATWQGPKDRNWRSWYTKEENPQETLRLSLRKSRKLHPKNASKIRCRLNLTKTEFSPRSNWADTPLCCLPW